MIVEVKNPFHLRKFVGVDQDCVTKLEAAGIKHSKHMLEAGRTPEQRAALSQALDLPPSFVLEMVRLSDLARLPGVKGIRARLYHDAGVGSVEELAGWQPEALLAMTAEFVERTGFQGIAPLPKEVHATIENARNLPQIIEWRLAKDSYPLSLDSSLC